jgi:hypothetical protein
MNEGVWE